jgi:hypothetical protein
MNATNEAQTEAIAAANAHLTNAGLPSYEELVALLEESRELGLTFDIGNAYIRRSYIDKQDELVRKIKAIPRLAA